MTSKQGVSAHIAHLLEDVLVLLALPALCFVRVGNTRLRDASLERRHQPDQRLVPAALECPAKT